MPFYIFFYFQLLLSFLVISGKSIYHFTILCMYMYICDNELNQTKPNQNSTTYNPTEKIIGLFLYSLRRLPLSLTDTSYCKLICQYRVVVKISVLTTLGQLSHTRDAISTSIPSNTQSKSNALIDW